MSLSKRILGIDYGSKRIGIAVTDPLNIIARGVKTIFNTSQAIDEIKHIIDEFEVDTIVIGLPLNLKGKKGQQALEVEKFAHVLEITVGREVVYWDERFTSQTSHQTLIDMGVKKKQRQSKSKIDEMAAALILQSYLDCRKS
jgi:putative holliday junction resolvase